MKKTNIIETEKPVRHRGLGLAVAILAIIATAGVLAIADVFYPDHQPTPAPNPSLTID